MVIKSVLSPHRYESTSSDDSSSESSDEGSDSSEYHEAREKLPESTLQHQQFTHNRHSDRTGVPQQAAATQPSPHQPSAVDMRQSEKAFQSPATHCPAAADATLNPASKAARVDQPGEQATAPRSGEPTSGQTSTVSQVKCSSSLVAKTIEVAKQQHTGTTVQAEPNPPAESSDAVSAPATPARVELSDGLMSALHILQKALGEPNAFSHEEAVGVFIC